MTLMFHVEASGFLRRMSLLSYFCKGIICSLLLKNMEFLVMLLHDCTFFIEIYHLFLEANSPFLLFLGLAALLSK